MSSIRLYKRQIEHLQRLKVSGSDIIRFAIKRFLRNEFVTQKIESQEELKVYSIRNKNWKQSDEEVRNILEAHFKNPRDYKAQLKSLDESIAGHIKNYSQREFLLEEEL